MGAKQSKRSVDISGKEAEGAGEVAAAGAGGEGRVEPLADADALKPQLNGDAHVQETTDKEKQTDAAGTPEIEKDISTEKEGKEQETVKEAVPATNGESEKIENGEQATSPEESKKPKKEKVKKKWSLRSISFSRKDKPKQEKKQKEEETKTNGEPEKVPEEAVEKSAESSVNEVNKNDKTPETPVTEPITNGSSTPESSKDETPITEEHDSTINSQNTEPKTETETEQLPVNGLSLEDLKEESPKVEVIEENKPEKLPVAVTPEITPVLDNSVKKEEAIISDKLADIIPEIPVVPELKMETETTSDVAVAN